MGAGLAPLQRLTGAVSLLAAASLLLGGSLAQPAAPGYPSLDLTSSSRAPIAPAPGFCGAVGCASEAGVDLTAPTLGAMCSNCGDSLVSSRTLKSRLEGQGLVVLAEGSVSAERREETTKVPFGTSLGLRTTWRTLESKSALVAGGRDRLNLVLCERVPDFTAAGPDRVRVYLVATLRWHPANRRSPNALARKWRKWRGQEERPPEKQRPLYVRLTYDGNSSTVLWPDAFQATQPFNQLAVDLDLVADFLPERAQLSIECCDPEQRSCRGETFEGRLAAVCQAVDPTHLTQDVRQQQRAVAVAAKAIEIENKLFANQDPAPDSTEAAAQSVPQPVGAHNAAEGLSPRIFTLNEAGAAAFAGPGENAGRPPRR